MKIVKEQAWGGNWGIDPTAIKYPGISSCVTITYYYPGPLKLLAGIHFGQYNPCPDPNVVTEITELQIRTIHNRMLSDTRLKGRTPAAAICIGVFGWPGGQDKFIRQLAEATVRRAPKKVPSDYACADVLVYISGNYNVKNTSSTSHGEELTGSFPW